MDFAAKPTALRRMPGNLPSERRRSGSSTPGHVRPEGTPPRKSEATQAKTAPARSHSTRGRRQRRSARCPSRQARPSIPTATTTTGDSRRGTGNGGNGSVRGFQGAFFSGGGCGRLVAGVAWRRLLLLCAGETASGGAPPRHSHDAGGSQPAHGPRRTARPGAETSPGLLAAPEQVGDPDTEHPGSRHEGHRRHGCRGRRKAITERAPGRHGQQRDPCREGVSC